MIVPVYAVAFVYFTVIAVLGCIYVQVSWIECLRECFQKLFNSKRYHLESNTVLFSYAFSIPHLGFILIAEPYWLALSATEFALVQLFVVAGVYITRRLNEISGLDCVRRAQKRDLWRYMKIPFLFACFVITTLFKTMNCFPQPDKKGAIKSFPRKASFQI